MFHLLKVRFLHIKSWTGLSQLRLKTPKSPCNHLLWGCSLSPLSAKLKSSSGLCGLKKPLVIHHYTFIDLNFPLCFFFLSFSVYRYSFYFMFTMETQFRFLYFSPQKQARSATGQMQLKEPFKGQLRRDPGLSPQGTGTLAWGWVGTGLSEEPLEGETGCLWGREGPPPPQDPHPSTWAKRPWRWSWTICGKVLLT